MVYKPYKAVNKYTRTEFSMHFINGEDATCKVENVDCKVAG